MKPKYAYEFTHSIDQVLQTVIQTQKAKYCVETTDIVRTAGVAVRVIPGTMARTAKMQVSYR